MENTVLFPILGIFFVWITILSIKVFLAVSHYNQLSRGISQNSLTSVLEKILQAKVENKKHIDGLEKAFIELEKQELTHLQRLGIVRFNPFSDTGGSQSFTFAILDGQDNGIVMTSLYARTGNRWYIKHIRKGKGVGVELSKEEQSAIKEAKPLT